MARRVISDDCFCGCGGTVGACCFYSERLDPDTLYVTIPPLGWNTLHYPTQYNQFLFTDREGPLNISPGYVDPHFVGGLTVEVNWVNDLRLHGIPPSDCITELCTPLNARGFQSCNCEQRVYASDLILGDIDAARTAMITYESEVVSATYVTSAIVVVTVAKRPMGNPPFGFNNLYFDGCGVSIEAYFLQLVFLSPVYYGQYNPPDDYQSVASMTNEFNCAYDSIIAKQKVCTTPNDFLLGGLFAKIAPLGTASAGGSFTIGTVSACNPDFPGIRTPYNFFGGGLCYGYLPKLEANPTLPNRFIPTHTFHDIETISTSQYFHSFCGDASEFSITW